MLPRRIPAVLTAVLVSMLLLPAPSARAEPLQPEAVTALTATPGMRPGEIVFQWQSAGANTDYFQLETAITTFSATDPAMARSGRLSKTLRISATARSLTLTAAQTAAAGAGVGTGRHLYFLLVAVNEEPGGTRIAAFPRAQAVMPRGLAAVKTTGTRVRAATFNVRTARAVDDLRPWLSRATAVATEINSHRLGVVALQELSPGRADGLKTSTSGSLRQTTSLLQALGEVGGSRYRLVRTTPYVKPGTPHGSQGTRILYDSNRYRLRSNCAETTDGRQYNSSCTIRLPLLPEDGAGLRRRAAYAELQDRRTGRRFFVVSAHLDQRHSTVLADEVRYNQLRGLQAAAIVRGVARVNPKGRKVVFGGDINSWQTNRIGHAPHDVLLANRFFDTASAKTVVNIEYGTSNRFAPVVQPNPYGFGTRIDAVLVQGTRGANRFENVLKPVDDARPSDHNLVLADLVL